MNIRNTSVLFFMLSLTFWINQNAIAENIYQWTDDDDVIYFSHSPPENISTKLAYKEASGETAYQWKDEQGNIHFSDAPPSAASNIKLTEIKLEPFDNGNIEPEKYSIIKQMERMTESRKQLEEERLARKKAKLEEEKTVQEMEILRQNEFFRKHGYGPRPYYYPYSRRNDYYGPGYKSYRYY